MQNQNKNHLSEIIDFINKSESIALLSHIGPDGDGIGSILALKFALQSLGKNVFAVASGGIPTNYYFLNGAKSFQQKINLDKIDCIISLDVSNEERLDLYQEKYKNKMICIDHHPHNTRFAHYNYIDLKVSSTAEMVGDLILELKIKFTKKIGEALLTGILFDTGNLTHNFYPNTLKIIGKCVETGAKINFIKQKLHSIKDIQVFNLWGDVLSKLVVLDKNKMVYSVIDKNDLSKIKVPYQDLNLDQLSNLLSCIDEGNSSLLLTEIKEKQYKASLRSENFKDVDVSVIAKKFGGGGHIRASGFKYKGEIDELLDEI